MKKYVKYFKKGYKRFGLVTFIEKFKTRVKNLKIEKIIAFALILRKLSLTRAVLRILFSPQ